MPVNSFPVKPFIAVDDSTLYEVTIEEWAIEPQYGYIVAFKAGGVHYHLKKHQDPHHVWAEAKGAAAGAGAAALIGKPGGAAPLMSRAITGSLIFYAAELAHQKLNEHAGRTAGTLMVCSGNDTGQEVYWGPVSSA